VFLEANAKYPVSELIKSIVVCSANDSCVAMAEKLAGSQQLFVDRMNEKACALGMHNTLFVNCTGLPQETQYSCAKDVAIMLKELLQYEQYYEYGKVWTDHFNHPQGRQTEITNTNKLIRFYDGCDGGKTGFTNEAGFCLAATAKRNGMRVISVIIGAENSVNRFEDTRMLFDYVFATYHTLQIVEEGQPLEQKFTVNGGKSKEISVQPARSAYIFAKKGEKTDYEMEACVSAIKAPVKKGARLGELLIFKGGIEVDRIPLLAAENVEMASWGDRMQDVAKNWNG
jgi:D-alanyl-D-alanine carboxypeptidase (penicillin-binding protein 5/6)